MDNQIGKFVSVESAGEAVLRAASITTGLCSSCHESHGAVVALIAKDGSIFAEAHMSRDVAIKIANDLIDSMRAN